MTSDSAGQYDPAWDDPLPHELSPTKYYLSPLSRGQTKAVVVFMHGRDDNIHDMVGVFLPILFKRYGGIEGPIEEGEESGGGEKKEQVDGKVAVVGIEARDYSWYPSSHHAMQEHQVMQNDLYQYSSLEKLRCTILSSCESTGLPPDRFVLVGFSQGANLANSYLKAGLHDIKRTADGSKSVIPLPGHILALAGSLFATAPRFPIRSYASADHEDQVKLRERQRDEKLGNLARPAKVVDRLLCGTNDRFFSQEEIKAAASSLVADRVQVSDQIEVAISVGLEPNAPHMITSRMVAATIEAIDAILERE